MVHARQEAYVRKTTIGTPVQVCQDTNHARGTVIDSALLPRRDHGTCEPRLPVSRASTTRFRRIQQIHCCCCCCCCSCSSSCRRRRCRCSLKIRSRRSELNTHHRISLDRQLLQRSAELDAASLIRYFRLSECNDKSKFRPLPIVRAPPPKKTEPVDKI